MFPRDEMTTLHTADECKGVASEAAEDQQLAEVAYLINNAANTGETTARYLQKLLPEVKAELESKGYSLRNSGGADPDSSVDISWS